MVGSVLRAAQEAVHFATRPTTGAGVFGLKAADIVRHSQFMAGMWGVRQQAAARRGFAVQAAPVPSAAPTPAAAPAPTPGSSAAPAPG